MNDAERINRATRAQAAWEEFMAPMIAELKAEYTQRLVDVASQELSRDKRSDKITALSNALKIVGNLETGMQAIIKDGEMAHRELVRSDNIERLTRPQRRLLNAIPY